MRLFVRKRVFVLCDQVNPALTLALLATRKLEVLRAVVYMAAQCLGACLGAGALYLALPVKTTAEHFVNKVSTQNISGLPIKSCETLHLFRIFLCFGLLFLLLFLSPYCCFTSLRFL